VSLAGLDPHRGGTKTYKAELLRRQEYDTLLLGSSRTEVGIDPASEAWGTATVFDASVPGTNMWETRQVLSFAMSRHTPTHVVLFADFLMFNDRRSTTGSFTRSRFSSDLNAIEYTLGNALSLPTTRDSLRVLARRVYDTPGPLSRQGHRTRRAVDLGRDGSPISQVADHRRAFRSSLHIRRGGPAMYASMDYPNDRVDMLREMVALCHERGITLTLVIPPMHALRLVILDAMGLWPSFERWKRDMVAAAGAVDRLEVWDFAYCHTWAAEAIPPADDTETRMEWWVDGGHFRPALGEVVLRRVLRRASAGAPTCGMELTASNVQERLLDMRRSLDTYVATHPDEAAWVRGGD
jgi:hypothetical protein